MSTTEAINQGVNPFSQFTVNWYIVENSAIYRQRRSQRQAEEAAILSSLVDEVNSHQLP